MQEKMKHTVKEFRFHSSYFKKQIFLLYQSPFPKRRRHKTPSGFPSVKPTDLNAVFCVLQNFRYEVSGYRFRSVRQYVKDLFKPFIRYDLRRLPVGRLGYEIRQHHARGQPSRNDAGNL